MVQRINVSPVYLRMGRIAEAYDTAAEAAGWFRVQEQSHSLATALVNQGTAAARLDRTDEAITLRTIRVPRTGDRLVIGRTLSASS